LFQIWSGGILSQFWGNFREAKWWRFAALELVMSGVRRWQW
jgi:hypothetical protein